MPALRALCALPLAALLACAAPSPDTLPRASRASRGARRSGAPHDGSAIAEEYVKLVLAAGRHDDGLVDAYYGPPEWKTEADADEGAASPNSRPASTALVAEAAALQPHPAAAIDHLHILRAAYLLRQLQALGARLDMLAGKRLTFDQESQALYDAVAPHLPAEHFAAVLAELEPLVPGDGPLPAARRGLPAAVRHPVASASTPSSAPPSTSAAAAPSPTSSCRPARASSSSTSPAAPGAPTTGTRAASTA